MNEPKFSHIKQTTTVIAFVYYTYNVFLKSGKKTPAWDGSQIMKYLAVNR